MASERLPSLSKLGSTKTSPHEHRPAPSEVGVVDRQPDPARQPDIRATERVVACAEEGAVDEGGTEAESRVQIIDRKSTRLNSSHSGESRMPSSA